jgi:putative peptidoglycan lipid II flippase
MLMLLWLLDRKLNGLPWREWSLPILGLAAGSVVTGVASYGTLVISQRFLGKEGLLILVLELCVSGFVGLAVFAAIASWLKIPEVNIFISRLSQRFLKK